nr:MAG TPA: hypothetical protein [Caudoviricetes sp.]
MYLFLSMNCCEKKIKDCRQVSSSFLFYMNEK